MAIIVRDLESDVSIDAFDVSAEVVLDGVARRLTFRRFGDHPALRDRTDTLDPFAVALLLPSMIRGEPLVIEGSIDERLLLALKGPVQATLALLDTAWRQRLAHTIHRDRDPRASVAAAVEHRCRSVAPLRR